MNTICARQSVISRAAEQVQWFLLQSGFFEPNSHFLATVRKPDRLLVEFDPVKEVSPSVMTNGGFNIPTWGEPVAEL